jgi:hypothetical protein
LYTIGITGHRRLPSGELETIADKVRQFIASKRTEHKDLQVMSSLAEGADILCARLALDLGVRLVVPLPVRASEYRRNFASNEAGEFDCLLSLADEAFVVQPMEPVPTNPTDGFYYRQAGIYVAEHCDVLLAVWDGVEKDTSDGAGTWETVKLARTFSKDVTQVHV